MAPFIRFDRCCNPFNERHHLKKKGLRSPSSAILKKMPSLMPKHLICTPCRKKIAAASPPPSTSDLLSQRSDIITTTTSWNELDSENSDLSICTKLPVINEALELLGNSPIQEKHLNPVASTSKELVHKTEKFVSKLKNELAVKHTETDSIVHDFTEMVASLKEKFHLPCTTHETKIELLTLMPSNWSIRKTAKTMKCSYHLAKVAKNVVAEKRVLSKPNKKIGKRLSSEAQH